jgi:predicted ATPase/class 3 adenylate cyclase
MPSALVIRLFGPLEFLLNGTPLSRLHMRKGHWLLALLVLRQGAEVERSWLAGLLWPNSSESEAYASLRVSLSHLRSALDSEASRLRSPTLHTLCLDLEGADVDVLAFDAAIARGNAAALERAVALYRGPLLEGCAEEWAFQERQVREQGYLQALETLAAGAMTQGDPAAAAGYLQRATVVDPLRESAQRGLMRGLAAAGNYAAALLTYRELRLRLHRELNAEPDPETQALFEEIRAEARRRAGRGPITDDRRRTTVRPCGDGAEELASKSPRVGGRWSVAGRRPPEGTVTFLLTDIEGSTRLWLQHPEAMRQALARHDALAAAIIPQHDGLLIKQRGEGDSLFAVFARASDAVAAALQFQQALVREAWPAETPLRVRVALHTGEAELREGDYFGLAVNHCARLRALGHGGQTLLSQTTAALVGEDLPTDMSLRDLGAHRLKDLQRAEPIFQLMHPELPAAFPPLQSLEAFAHNLPVQLTSFIGREREMAEVKRLLTTTHLLTLIGAGGCGKTRLALQVAADRVEDSRDGAWLVELAALADPGLVPQTVASALGMREEPGRPLTDTLADALRPRALLLVLDNCEHLVAACAHLAETLLQRCANLRILATSREGLRIAGETTYQVPPLSLPPAEGVGDRGARVGSESVSATRLPTPDTLLQSEAARLFVERATAALPSFTLNDQTAAALASVCRRLDGIPLAIELAAARVRALHVEQIAARMDDFFRLLTGGSRTALPRQQTLKATIDWSYNLLSAPEQGLLCRLSVFLGGWTLEAAEAVCVDDSIAPWEVFELLTGLVDKSLVVLGERGGEMRYRLLQTVRQYAADRLAEGAGAEAVRSRHRDYFLSLAEEARLNLEGPGQHEWLDRLETEHENLRAALEWSRAHGQAEAGLRLGGALSQFWHVRGYAGEGREHLAQLLALPGAEARTSARAHALMAAGMLARRQGEYAAARALLEESLTIFRELEDKEGIAGSLRSLGWATHDQEDLGAAQALWEESLALFRELGDKGGIVSPLWGLGSVAREQGDYRAARAFWEESLALCRELEDRFGIAVSLNYLGWTACDQGEYEKARALWEESLALFRELGLKQGIAKDLEGLAAVAVAQAQPERAARLFGVAEALRAAIGAPLPPAEHAEHERFHSAGRAALGEEAFAAAWAAGRVLSLEQAVAYALEQPDPLPATQ